MIIGSVTGVTCCGGADAGLLIVSQGDVWGDKRPDTFRGVKGADYAVLQTYTIGEDFVDFEMQGGWNQTDKGLLISTVR